MTHAPSTSGLELTSQLKTSHNFKLSVVQQPLTGKAVSTNLRARGMKWPIEPPPVLELTSGEKEPQKWLYIHNPNWFCVADLIFVEPCKKTTQRKDNKEGGKDNLSGLLASSLHKVKNPDDRNEHGYFVFGDLNVRDAGRYKLEFTLFEMRRYTTQQGDTIVYAAKVDSIQSHEFDVSHKQTLPSKDSTKLSKVLSESGVKIRLRKESTKRKQPTVDWSATATENLGFRNHPATLAPIVNYPSMAPPSSNPSSRLNRNSGEDVSRRLSVVQHDMTIMGSSQGQSASPLDSQQSAGGHGHSFGPIGGVPNNAYDYALQHTLSPGSKLPTTFPPPSSNQLPYQPMISPVQTQPWTFPGQGTFRPESSHDHPQFIGSQHLPDPRMNHERVDSGYSSHGRSSLTHLEAGTVDPFSTRSHGYAPTSMPSMQLSHSEALQQQEWSGGTVMQGYSGYDPINSIRQPDLGQHNMPAAYMFQAGHGPSLYSHNQQTSQP